MLDPATFDSDEVKVTFKYVSRSRIASNPNTLTPLDVEAPNPSNWAILTSYPVDAGILAFVWRKIEVAP